MTEDELCEWVIDKFNSCYKVEYDYHPGIILFYYDISYIRKKKLYKLINKYLTQTRKLKGDGCCLFMLNTKLKYLYCNYDIIWSFFNNNDNINKYSNYQIQTLIKNALKLDMYLPVPHIGEIKRKIR